MLRITGGVKILGLSDYPQIYIDFGFTLVGLCLFWVSGTYGSCSKPELPLNSYTLKESKSTYAAKETYEILCVPGFTLSGSTTLTCSSSGQWMPNLPSCSSSELVLSSDNGVHKQQMADTECHGFNKGNIVIWTINAAMNGSYPWWMLLVGVTIFIIVVACIVPRLVQCLIGKRKKNDKSKNRQSPNDEDDKLGDSEHSNWTATPVIDFSGIRQSNMDYTRKIERDLQRLQIDTKNNTAF